MSTADNPQINAGWLLPALHRVERDGRLQGAWDARDDNRRAQCHEVTAKGRKTLERATSDGEVQTAAIARILRASQVPA